LKQPRGFASDNNAGVHPLIMRALRSVNSGHVIAYGDDPWTAAAVARLREHFGAEVHPFFVYNGTAANVLGLSAVTRSFHSVICAASAHIQVDECGAPEKFAGCKLLPVPAPDGKLTIEAIRPHLHGFDFEHHSQPRVVSITQATELGTVYTPHEIRRLADFVHGYGMLLHMDGARLANAAVAQNTDLRTLTFDAGADIVSFGGTKNGLMFGEALLFAAHIDITQFKYLRKQGMQLASKMRFIAAQFEALLANDLWRRNATHANRMALYLAQRIRALPGVRITRPVEANAVFVILPPAIIPPLQAEYFFYLWDETQFEARLMTAFDTTKADIDHFIATLNHLLMNNQ